MHRPHCVRIINIVCESSAYDSRTGIVSTQQVRDIPVTLVAEDESGNEAKIDAVIRIVPIRVTSDNRNPVVYDGELGTVTIGSLYRGSYGYEVTLDYSNTADESMIAIFSGHGTSINGIQVPFYYADNFLPSGVTGTFNCTIYYEDIPDDIGEFTQIDTSVVLATYHEDEEQYRIPVVIDVSAFD